MVKVMKIYIKFFYFCQFVFDNCDLYFSFFKNVVFLENESGNDFEFVKVYGQGRWGN